MKNTLIFWLLAILSLSAFAKNEIVIDLEGQHLYFFHDGELWLACPVTTGKDATPTPEGKFRVVRKEFNHHSKEFNASMLWALLIGEKRGIFIHQGVMIPSETRWKNGSHACVRVDWLSAKTLSKIATVGDSVEVVKGLSTTLTEKIRKVKRGRINLFFDPPKVKGTEGVCRVLGPKVKPFGNAKVGSVAEGADVEIDDNVVALALGSYTRSWENYLPNVDPEVWKFIKGLPENTGGMIHLYKPEKGLVTERLWVFDGGSWGITVTLKDLDKALIARSMDPKPPLILK